MVDATKILILSCLAILTSELAHAGQQKTVVDYSQEQSNNSWCELDEPTQIMTPLVQPWLRQRPPNCSNTCFERLDSSNLQSKDLKLDLKRGDDTKTLLRKLRDYSRSLEKSREEEIVRRLEELKSSPTKSPGYER